jgi:hypothetical protein
MSPEAGTGRKSGHTESAQLTRMRSHRSARAGFESTELSPSSSIK